MIGFVLPLGFQLVQFVYGDANNAEKTKGEIASLPANEQVAKSQALPLGTKVEDQFGREVTPRRTIGNGAPTTSPAAQSPGMSNGMGAMQWAIVILFASFYASYAPDLYYAGACASFLYRRLTGHLSTLFKISFVVGSIAVADFCNFAWHDYQRHPLWTMKLLSDQLRSWLAQCLG